MGNYHSSSTRIGFGLFGFFGLLTAFAGCSGSVTQTAGCDYKGKAYAVGDTFKDDCNTCSCGERGEVQCTLIGCGSGPEPGPSCSVGGKRYAPGEQVSNDGCNTCACTSSGDVVCTRRACPEPGQTCEALASELKGTLASVQKCVSAADCGQPIPGSSCGCTRDLVARKDADLTPYLAAKSKADAQGCASDGISTCDCPNADGFACVNNVCSWNYVKVEPEPVCKPYEASRLCVRGTPSADGELIEVGSALKVTAYSSGCFSSSCSKVVEASCSITSGSGFDVDANFCVVGTARIGELCTADCGTAHADCNFGQPLKAGSHQVRLGAIALDIQVPSKLPLGGLCTGTR